jgi:hypothetical protein
MDMTELISNISFILLGVLAVMIAAILLKVLRQGPSEIRRLRRAGYGVSNLVRPELPKENAGGTNEVMEGLEFIAENGRVVDIRQTRTISGEIA